MIPFGNVPIDPPTRQLPGGLETDRPDFRHHQQVTDPHHGTNINVIASDSELNIDVPINVLARNIGFQQAEASYPLLLPIALLRGETPRLLAESPLAKERYKKLLRRLSPALREAIEANEGLPKEHRDGALTGFAESLQWMALFMTSFQGFGKKEVEGDPEKEANALTMGWGETLDEEGSIFVGALQDYLTQFDGGAPEREILSTLFYEMRDAVPESPMTEEE